MDGSEMESKSVAQKPLLAIRCARAAILLSKINSSTSCRLKSASNDEEKEMMKREIEGLMMDLARERMKSRKIELCSLMELTLQVLVVLSVSTFLLVLFLNFR